MIITTIAINCFIKNLATFEVIYSSFYHEYWKSLRNNIPTKAILIINTVNSKEIPLLLIFS